MELYHEHITTEVRGRLVGHGGWGMVGGAWWVGHGGWGMVGWAWWVVMNIGRLLLLYHGPNSLSKRYLAFLYMGCGHRKPQHTKLR